jgi:hypothetical protein
MTPPASFKGLIYFCFLFAHVSNIMQLPEVIEKHSKERLKEGAEE